MELLLKCFSGDSFSLESIMYRSLRFVRSPRVRLFMGLATSSIIAEGFVVTIREN